MSVQGCTFDEQRQDDANGKANENALDEADLVVLPKYCGDCQGNSPLSSRASEKARHGRTTQTEHGREMVRAKGLEPSRGLPTRT